MKARRPRGPPQGLHYHYYSAQTPARSAGRMCWLCRVVTVSLRDQRILAAAAGDNFRAGHAAGRAHTHANASRLR